MPGSIPPDDPTRRDDAAAARHAEAADSLYARGRFREALQHYEAAAGMGPAPAALHVKAAKAAWQAGSPRLVEPHFLHALRIDPDHADAHHGVSQWYFEKREMAAALSHSARAIQLAPNDPDVVMSRATVLEGNARPEEAWRLIEPMVRARKAYVRLGLLFGRIAPAVRREREAAGYVEWLLQFPAVGDAERSALQFTAAGLLDRLGKYDQAFELARRAKGRARGSYDAQAFTRWTDRQIDYFTAGRLRSLPRATRGNGRPVFVVGMPRSGTSLVEQILSAHPDVYAAGELEALDRVIESAGRSEWAKGAGYPNWLDALAPARADAIAGEYLSVISAMNGAARYVTDKNPQNFRWLGFLSAVLPESRVIHCRRDPLDTCLSCYLTFYTAPGSEALLAPWRWPPAGTLADLGAYYRDYVRLMRHWKDVSAAPILDVNYEQMVGDAEGEIRRLLEFLGLPWDDNCLKFHERDRVVNTPSQRQVRRPLYSSSVGRWRHYGGHLGELVRVLSDAGIPTAAT